jgi:hypothetical protein
MYGLTEAQLERKFPTKEAESHQPFQNITTESPALGSVQYATHLVTLGSVFSITLSSSHGFCE